MAIGASAKVNFYFTKTNVPRHNFTALHFISQTINNFTEFLINFVAMNGN